MTSRITKAVLPVAGFGTRFLPATKATPKEMLPIVDKPLVQYAVEEAVAAGIKQLIFVTSSSKHAIENHFDTNFELESKLEEADKTEMLDLVRDVLPPGISCVYVRQQSQLGLGHAVLCAKDIVGDEPFSVLLADDLINSKGKGCLGQMIDVYSTIKSSILAVQPVEKSETKKYGIVELDNKDIELGDYSKAKGIIEKPKPEDAPSNYASIGRYILTPKIFHYLENLNLGAGGEIQLADAIHKLLLEEDVYSYRFYGKRYDCGNKLGYLAATIEYGMEHPEIGKDFIDYLRYLNID